MQSKIDLGTIEIPIIVMGEKFSVKVKISGELNIEHIDTNNTSLCNYRFSRDENMKYLTLFIRSTFGLTKEELDSMSMTAYIDLLQKGIEKTFTLK
jgi:hypothetical protein